MGWTDSTRVAVLCAAIAGMALAGGASARPHDIGRSDWYGVIHRQAARPLVIIIPGNQESVSGIASTDQADGETITMRAMRAAGKVRDYLNDSRQVEATLYSPDSPLFVRAALEAKIKAAKRYNLSDDEQVSLSKAAGAIYVAVIGIQRASDGGDGYEMTLQGLDVASRKPFTDRAKYIVRKADRSTDVNAIRVETSTSPVNAVNSAANTLVTRLLNGPLAAYGRVAPPPVLTPSKPDAAPDPAVNSEADMVNGAVQQANALIADSNSGGAITLLRHTINQSPLNLKLRLLLARAYLASNRNTDAATEVKRALVLIAPSETERREAAGLLADAFQKSGNSGAARATYEEIIATQPNSVWARLALADLLEAQAPDVAEAQYQAVLKADPGNQEAARGVAHLLALRGDFDAAIAAIAPGDQSNTARQTRDATAAALFDEFAAQATANLRTNRTAWENRKMTREAFYKATVALTKQAGSLVTMVKAITPPDKDASAKRNHAHRLLAASLLAQSATALQTFLETGDKEAGAQSAVWLTECQKEIASIK